MQIKPKLLVCPPTIHVAHNFFNESKIFEELNTDYEISVCANSGNKGANREVFEGKGFGKVFGLEVSKRRQKVYLWQFHMNTWGGRKYSNNSRVAYEMNKLSYGSKAKRFVHKLLGLNYFLAKFLNIFFEAYIGLNEALVKVVDEVEPDLIITFMNGSSPLEVEVMKVANAKSIPCLSLQFGWDNINTRGILPYLPDYAGVWGYHSKRTMQRMHQYPPERIFHVGAPFIDCYNEKIVSSESEIKRKLQVPLDKKLIVFIGTANAFCEVKMLKDLVESLQELGLEDKTHILYRPHPTQHYEKHDLDFFEQGFQNVSIDPELYESYKQAKIDKTAIKATKDRLLIGFKHINEIFSVTKFIVAPLSTVMIQAATKGVPSIGLVYVYEQNKRFSKRYLFDEINIIRSMPGVFQCAHPKQLKETCRLIYEFQADQKKRDLLQHYSTFAIQNDGFRYSERLKNAIEAILSEKSNKRNSMFNYLSEPVSDFPNEENVVSFKKAFVTKSVGANTQQEARI